MDNEQAIIEKREHRRVRAVGQYRIRGNINFPLEVIDIAEGGAGIKSFGPLERGDLIELDLFFPDNSEFTVTVRVIWVRPLDNDPREARCDAGLRFVNVADDARKKIYEFVEKEAAQEGAA